jgi:hydrogenase expression/formation protein HypE
MKHSQDPSSRIITLSHGSGGRLQHDLIRELYLPRFGSEYLRKGDDQAVFPIEAGRLAFTTDTFVVRPIVFPGGDIGKLAVCGTVNDLAVGGAVPEFISLSFVLEEGLPFETFERILDSIVGAAKEARVEVVTGDTKVVERGAADKMFINTSGVGLVRDGVDLSGRNAKIGDKVLISGTIGDHGIAVVTEREGFQMEGALETDCAPLNHLVEGVLDSGAEVHCMRDPTRGGLATTLNEIAYQSNVTIEIADEAVPIRPEVVAACELLGYDQYYVANEGKIVAFVAPQDPEKALAAMREARYGADAAIIGEVTASGDPLVLLKTRLGSRRILDMLSGELLPRIC